MLLHLERRAVLAKHMMHLQPAPDMSLPLV